MSRKTRAYLQYGDAAFLHVEELLNQQLGFDVAGGKGPSPSSILSTTREDDETVVLVPVPSVGIESMDNEHASCEEALAVLLQTNTIEALEAVMTELVEHFDHEEHLMRTHNFGRAEDSSTDAFTPFESHCKDHARILDIGYRALSQADSASITCGAGRDS